MFVKLMKLSLVTCCSSNFHKCKNYSKLPADCLFVMFVTCVKQVMQCNMLARMMEKWYNENSGNTEKEFSFRFRGKESYLYLKHFPALCKMLFHKFSNDEVKVMVLSVLYQSICLRKVISLMVRIESCSPAILDDLDVQCRDLFVSCSVYQTNLSPSMWVLCNVVPVHARETFHLYHMGLGCNTMEGREQKHQMLKKYADNTTFQNRWPDIFRHEYIQLLYLRENGYDKRRYLKRGCNYIPKHVAGNCSKCALPIDSTSNNCVLCDSSLMLKINSQVEEFR